MWLHIPERPRASGIPRRRTWRVGLLVGAAALVLVVGVAAVTYTREDPYAAYVDFAPLVPYAAALRTITSLGLQTALPCFGGYAGGRQHLQWSPMGEQDMLQDHRLWVASTPIAAAYWLLRLSHASGVAEVQSGAGLTFACPDLLPVTSPDLAGFLNADEAGTYVRVTFDAPLVSYDDALAAVENLGLRLADPCSERSAGHSIPLLWHTMDQSAAFAASDVLVVATTIYASTAWREQLQAAQGVATVQAPAATSCP
jgi:hypothetical protein